MQNRRFPSDFVWGTATSSYQIEGAVHEAGRGASIWDTFCQRPGAIKDGTDGAVACDHWHRYPADVALMKQLGVGAYRLSIAWPRLFPTGLEDRPIREGLDVYDRLIDELLEAGIDPWVTLYHWDLPQGLEDRGGWINRDIVDRFVQYSAAVAGRLGDRVGHWITHNEPWCVAHLGYGIGLHAPGGTDLAASLVAAHHVLLSHGKALPVLRSILPDDAKVGITLNFSPSEPASPSDADAAACHLHDGFFNRWYLHPLIGRGYPQDMLDHYAERNLLHDTGPTWLKPGDLEAISQPMDFLGLNYYSRSIVRDHGAHDNAPRTIPEPTDDQKTDIGWEVFPDGLYNLLTRLHRDAPHLPLVITENGAAYHTGPDAEGHVDDVRREHYLREHLRACRRAMDDGVDLKGYFAWSLMDNFEWQEGYTQRFGIVYVDYETQERIPKRSFHWFKRAIEANGVPEDQ